jgi:hypothetical protein
LRENNTLDHVYSDHNTAVIQNQLVGITFLVKETLGKSTSVSDYTCCINKLLKKGVVPIFIHGAQISDELLD